MILCAPGAILSTSRLSIEASAGGVGRGDVRRGPRGDRGCPPLHNSWKAPAGTKNSSTGGVFHEVNYPAIGRQWLIVRNRTSTFDWYGSLRQGQFSLPDFLHI